MGALGSFETCFYCVLISWCHPHLSPLRRLFPWDSCRLCWGSRLLPGGCSLSDLLVCSSVYWSLLFCQEVWRVWDVSPLVQLCDWYIYTCVCVCVCVCVNTAERWGVWVRVEGSVLIQPDQHIQHHRSIGPHTRAPGSARSAHALPLCTSRFHPRDERERTVYLLIYIQKRGSGSPPLSSKRRKKALCSFEIGWKGSWIPNLTFWNVNILEGQIDIRFLWPGDVSTSRLL